MLRRVGVALFVVVATLPVVSAQWLNYPTPGIPRLPNGKPDLAAKAPRTADGKPDLSGVWHVLSESLEEKKRLFGPGIGVISVPGMEPDTISRYGVNILLDVKPGEIVMTPEGQAVFNRRRNDGEPLPTTHCLPMGTPLATLLSEVQKIVQTPGVTLIVHEIDGIPRQIYTDGRKLPADPAPSWLGSSVGRWDGDTLVVDTVGLNDRAWLDISGHPRSEAMRMTERYRRRDVGHLDVEYTFNDPKMYNKPFTVNVTHLLQADTDILEYVCNENEKDRTHMGLAAQAPAEAPQPVATMKQLMVDVIHPASNDILLLVNRGGPRDEKEWAEVRRSALALAECGNVLIMRNRVPAWVADARMLTDVGTAAYKAAAAKDAKALAALTDRLDGTCTTCHKEFRAAVFPPPR